MKPLARIAGICGVTLSLLAVVVLVLWRTRAIVIRRCEFEGRPHLSIRCGNVILYCGVGIQSNSWKIAAILIALLGAAVIFWGTHRLRSL